jgi:hypothetical protein
MLLQLDNNLSGFKPVSMTDQIGNQQNIHNFQGIRQISSITQPINNNFQSNLMELKTNVEMNKRSKSNNKRELKINNLKLPEITKNKIPSKILKSNDKKIKKEKPSLNLPQIGLKKMNNHNNDKQQLNLKIGKERLRAEETKTAEEEKKPSLELHNKEYIGKWENKEIEEFEEFERKVENDLKHEKEEKNNKNINISE